MKTPSIITTSSMDGPVNLLRATSACNAFYIFFSASKAALIPFLTLFFRLIGLTAFETGVVMAAKTLTGFVWAPLWARCAVAYNKRRTVLMFSLLMMGAMYISFTAVYYKVHSPRMCEPASPVLDHHTHGNGSSSSSSSALNNTQNSGGGGPVASVEQSTKPANVSGASHEGGEGGSNKPSVKPTEKEEGKESPGHVTHPSKSGDGQIVPTTKAPSPTTHSEKKAGISSPSSAVPNKPTTTAGTPALVPHKTTARASSAQPRSKATQEHPSLSASALQKLLEQKDEETGMSLKDMMQKGKLTAADIRQMLSRAGLAEADIQKLLEQLKPKPTESIAKRSAPVRVPRNVSFTIFNDLKNGISALTASLSESRLLLFMIVLLIVIFGEFFSSPVEKIADDAWFDFLERIDDMERYGRQRYWGSLTFALVPIVVTCLVDYTPCRMVWDLHHFLLHFVVFGLFILLTFLVAFYFPMPPPVKQRYSSKVGKGLRVICCDGRGFLFVVTLLVAGAVYASFHNFLFWRLQDLGSGEVTMGLSVAISAFAETPMLVFSNKLVRRLGHGGLVSLSLLVLALRVLYYGFLWTPWAVLPAELTNAFTHTALWYAVLSYDEFNVGSAIDRSIRSILSSVYFGLGFSLGSFVSGAVYQMHNGSSLLFWGASVLSGSWCLVYSLIQCCLPKKERVKYIKLLRKEEDDSSEGDDDWLEMALKDQ